VTFANPVLVNPVKDKLARGEVVASMTVRLVPGVEVVRIAKTAGFDTLYIDLEHSGFSIETANQISLMALEAGVPAFVRVPANTPDYIGRVLDGGALGIIAPGVASAEEARAVVRAVKFPPDGRRGAPGAFAQLQYRSMPLGDAFAAVNAATMVMVQIESAASLERVEDIVAVPGIDLALVGTNDLTADLGIPGEYDHQKVHEAYERVLIACRRHGKHVGVGGLASRPDLVSLYVEMGARYVSTGSDLAFLLAECTRRAQQVRDIPL
jgi:2-keto-3-deoxy-L-rhamnonate aldolase RhmA